MSLKKSFVYPGGHAAPRGAYSPGLKVELPGGGVMLFQATGTVTAIELLTMP